MESRLDMTGFQQVPPGKGRGRSIEVNWEVGKAEGEKEKSSLAAPGTSQNYDDLFFSESLKSLIYPANSPNSF